MPILTPVVSLFDAAIDLLAAMHRATPPLDLPAWDAPAMRDTTIATLLDWWWPAMFGSAAPAAARADFAAALTDLLAPVAAGPHGFTHRDFFAGNLFWLPDRDGIRRVGVIDFQGASIGHPAYDLVSLLQDARRAIPPAIAARAFERYLAARPDLDAAAFRTAYAACAAQRHLRVAGQWVRLARRDNRPGLSGIWTAHLGAAERRPTPSGRGAAGRRHGPLDSPCKPRQPAGPRRMSTHPTTAMLLAAGRGTRMRPLTDATAKALLPLGGRKLIDQALDHLVEAGVDTVVVNAFWQADRLAAHLDGRRQPRIILRRESTLLDTGGGTRAALDVLGDAPFYTVNGDAFWLNGPSRALTRLAAAFDPDRVDAVLLVYRTAQVRAEVGFGDFMLDKWGAPRRREEREVVPYLYAGVQVISPALFAGAPDGPFSMNLLWDRAMAADRLRAVVHDGLWFHLSTPADLSDAKSVLALRQAG